MTARHAIVAMSLLLLLGGCSGVQSALDPQGPRAAEIATLAWLLFAVAGLVMLVVVAGTWLAIRGPAALRARLAGEGVVYAGGIAFPAIVLTGLLALGLALMRSNMAESGEPSFPRIEVTGEQWWWRVVYVGEDGNPVASANEIRIPAGRPVAFVLRSADVIHSFWVPALGGKVDMTPGRTTTLTLIADREGVYRGQCAEYCGGPHALMALPVRSVAPAEFDAWLEAQRAPATAAATETAGQGKTLFGAAGCGGCHTVRGTQSAGTIGPDLTHIGSRVSVGVDTLPMSAENLARFITDGQHIKPGNRMPPFRIFSDEELAALAGYLAGLK